MARAVRAAAGLKSRRRPHRHPVGGNVACLTSIANSLRVASTRNVTAGRHDDATRRLSRTCRSHVVVVLPKTTSRPKESPTRRSGPQRGSARGRLTTWGFGWRRCPSGLRPRARGPREDEPPRHHSTPFLHPPLQGTELCLPDRARPSASRRSSNSFAVRSASVSSQVKMRGHSNGSVRVRQWRAGFPELGGWDGLLHRATLLQGS